MEPQWPGDRGNEAAPANSGGGANRLPVLIGLLVVVAGLVAALTFLMVGGDDTSVATGDEASYVVTQAVAMQPVFEPKDDQGDDPFFPIDVQIASFQETTGQDVPAEAVESGLYGGTVDETCDPERLIAYLQDNPRKGHAWAAAQGIEFDELADYIRALDARVLATPALVLNHGYDEETGAPIEVEATLEAGTAVLVDENGDIRSRCYCGNPVKPRPAVYREQRCVGDASLVVATPGGSDSIAGASQLIELTSRVTDVDGVTWSEVTWEGADGATGWVDRSMLQRGLCTPEDARDLPADPIAQPTTPTAVATAEPTAAPTTAPTPAPTPTPRPTTAPAPTPTSPPAPQPTSPPAPTPQPTATAAPTPEPTPSCPDADGDGICNAPDNCRDTANPDQADIDNDGKGDACDPCTDIDGDLHCSETDDTCPDDYDPTLTDSDLDGIGDVCDNCPAIPNTNQADSDGNGIGNACEGGGITPTPVANDCTAGGYLGLDRGSAEAKANANQCTWRIMRIDHQNFYGTTDYRPDRMNWEIDNNIITNVYFG